MTSLPWGSFISHLAVGPRGAPRKRQTPTWKKTPLSFPSSRPRGRGTSPCPPRRQGGSGPGRGGQPGSADGRGGLLRQRHPRARRLEGAPPPPAGEEGPAPAAAGRSRRPGRPRRGRAGRSRLRRAAATEACGTPRGAACRSRCAAGPGGRCWQGWLRKYPAGAGKGPASPGGADGRAGPRPAPARPSPPPLLPRERAWPWGAANPEEKRGFLGGGEGNGGAMTESTRWDKAVLPVVGGRQSEAGHCPEPRW